VNSGASVVYRARVAAQGELLALKVLDTHKIQSERYARFVQEVRVLEDLRDFPGCPSSARRGTPREAQSAITRMVGNAHCDSA
jgi:hypothetical protein